MVLGIAHESTTVVSIAVHSGAVGGSRAGGMGRPQRAAGSAAHGATGIGTVPGAATAPSRLGAPYATDEFGLAMPSTCLSLSASAGGSGRVD